MFRFHRYSQNQNTSFASARTEACFACRPSDNKTAFIIIMDAIIMASFSVIIAVFALAAITLRLQVLALLVYLAFIVAVFVAIFIMAGLKRTHYCY